MASTVFSKPIDFVPADDTNVVHNTGNENIYGNKTFIDRLYIKNSTTTPNAVFYGTDMSAPSGGIFVQNAEVDGSKFGRTYFQFREVSPTSAGENTGYEERFNLPAAAYDLSETKSYNILTTRSAVSIAQGGTGMTAVSTDSVTTNGITASCRKWGKVVQVSLFGTLTSTVAKSTNFITLPSGYRPAAAIRTFCKHNGNVDMLYVGTNGGINNADNDCAKKTLYSTFTFIIS